MAGLHDKSVLVLGGSRGIGAAIVRRFAAEGAKVTFTYAASHEAAQALANEAGATAKLVDSADRDAVISLVRGCGSLDVLIVNAGIVVFGDPLDHHPDDVDRMFRINLHSPYHAAVEAARQMADGGRIILMGSSSGDRVPFAGMAAYAAAKSAIQGMVRGLARDLGRRGITVNAVQPGPIETDMNPADGPMKEFIQSFTAIDRFGRPDEVAGMVAWLAGPDAGFVSGAMHSIDGGFTA
jgi:cyclic-di-GMP-binding biofilm dispersal mediator protein